MVWEICELERSNYHDNLRVGMFIENIFIWRQFGVVKQKVGKNTRDGKKNMTRSQNEIKKK
jgi:hypothetical protein